MVAKSRGATPLATWPRHPQLFAPFSFDYQRTRNFGPKVYSTNRIASPITTTVQKVLIRGLPLRNCALEKAHSQLA
jgi:hypothetical protein